MCIIYNFFLKIIQFYAQKRCLAFCFLVNILYNIDFKHFCTLYYLSAFFCLPCIEYICFDCLSCAPGNLNSGVLRWASGEGSWTRLTGSISRPSAWTPSCTQGWFGSTCLDQINSMHRVRPTGCIIEIFYGGKTLVYLSVPHSLLVPSPLPHCVSRYICCQVDG